MTVSLNPSRLDRHMPAKIVYGLYALGAVVGFTVLAGAVYAYLAERGDPVHDSHLDYQITTFWVALAFSFAAVLATPLGIGSLLLAVLTVWGAARIVSGFLLLRAGRAVGRSRFLYALAKAG